MPVSQQMPEVRMVPRSLLRKWHEVTTQVLDNAAIDAWQEVHLKRMLAELETAMKPQPSRTGE